MKLDLAIGAVLDVETTLADRLSVLSGRHRADHDIHHLTSTLRRIAVQNIEALRPFADRYGTASAAVRLGGLIAAGISENAVTALKDESDAGVVLLRDLRDLHLLYAAASIDWVILSQGAQAARDRFLLSTVTDRHAQSLRGLKWTVTRIKAAAPQVLTS